MSQSSIAEINNSTYLSHDVKQLVYINKLNCTVVYASQIVSFYVGFFVLREQLPTFFSRINILDNFINVIISNNINLKQRRISIVVSVFGVLCWLSTYSYNIILSLRIQNMKFIFISGVLSIAMMQSFCCEILFASCCYSLWARLQVLNETLYEYFYCPLRNAPKNR